MKSYSILTLAALLASPAVVLAEPQTTAAATDLAGLVGQLQSLTAILGLTGSASLPTGSVVNPLAALGLPSAPANVLQEILTGVPASVYAGFANPTSRSMILSEFKAGHTPAWYTGLPADAQSYIQEVEAQAATMSLNTSPLASLSAGIQTLASDASGRLSSLATATPTGAKTTGTKTGTATGADATSTKAGSGVALQVSFSAAVVVAALSVVALL